MSLTLGSLFDGSGGFLLGAKLNGINPIWASEIEPFPIRVTTKRFPKVKHLGDIKSINGAEIKPVDIITFGSPCTDLSLAGKRIGIHGNQSSLFFEAIRVIKEMRDKTNGKYPRYILWENVPGAMHCSKGTAFREVLEEICKVKDKTITIPMPYKRWQPAGEIVGDNFSIAYKIFGAQYFGLPVRRDRIYLVADFNGQGSGKILFEYENKGKFNPQKLIPWFQATTACGGSTTQKISKTYAIASETINRNTYTYAKRPGCTEELCSTLTTMHPHAVCYKFKNESVIRYLTPSEYGLLQGFPKDWCSDLGIENPLEKEIKWWIDVFETRKRIMGGKKSKTQRQIIKWLKNPHSDTAEYKMWGNGVALPTVYYILGAIDYYHKNLKKEY